MLPLATHTFALYFPLYLPHAATCCCTTYMPRSPLTIPHTIPPTTYPTTVPAIHRLLHIHTTHAIHSSPPSFTAYIGVHGKPYNFHIPRCTTMVPTRIHNVITFVPGLLQVLPYTLRLVPFSWSLGVWLTCIAMPMQVVTLPAP